MQNHYTDTQLDCLDVNAAMRLCIGGVCLYKTKNGIGCEDQLVASEVTPSITSVFGEQVGAVLGKVLLWACFEASVVDLVAPDIRHNLIAKFITKNTGLPDGENPIERFQVVPSEVDGTVSMDEAPNEEGIEPGDNTGAASALAQNNVWWRAQMVTKCTDIRSKVTQLQQNQIAQFAVINCQQKRLEEMVHKTLVAPAKAITCGNNFLTSRVVHRETNGGGDNRGSVLHVSPGLLGCIFPGNSPGIPGNGEFP